MILALRQWRSQYPKPETRHLILLRLLCWLGLSMICLLCGAGAKAQSTPGDTRSPSRIKSDLKEILSEQEFRPESTDESLITKAVEKVRKQLETWWQNIRDFFRRLFGGAGGNPGTVNVAFVYTLIAVIAVAALWALYRVIVAFSGRKRKPATEVSAVTAQPSGEDAPLRPADEWIAEADRLAQGRDFRGAFRAVFLAILVQLDRAGKIEYRRSRTNGDYLRALRAHSLRALYDIVAPLAREFDLRWYGGRSADEADYRRCLAAYRQLPTVIGADMPAIPQTGGSDATPMPAKGA